MFKIEYTDSVKTIKLNVSEDNLEFINGYAVVEKELTETEMSLITTFSKRKIIIKGIVDETLKTIVPFKEDYDVIDIFKNSNFIITIKNQYGNTDITRTRTIHYKYNKETVSLEEITELPNKHYRIIDEDKIIITDSSSEQYNAIYDLEKGTIISNKFTSIEDFENGKALATKEINLGNLNASVYCYINKSGDIEKKIYNSLNNSYTDVDKDFNFENYIENVKSDLIEKKAKIENDVKQLLKM